MNEMVNVQTLLFIRSIQIGMVMGAGYDLIRVLRKIVKHFDWMVQVEDVLYWVVCSFVSFGLLYTYNYADIKLFCFIGMILGGILYFCTFSIVFMRIMTWAIEVLRRMIYALISFLKIPLLWLFQLLMMPVRCLIKLFEVIAQKNRQARKRVKRSWYHKKADIKTGIKVIKRDKFT